MLASIYILFDFPRIHFQLKVFLIADYFTWITESTLWSFPKSSLEMFSIYWFKCLSGINNIVPIIVNKYIFSLHHSHHNLLCGYTIHRYRPIYYTVYLLSIPQSKKCFHDWLCHYASNNEEQKGNVSFNTWILKSIPTCPLHTQECDLWLM